MSTVTVGTYTLLAYRMKKIMLSIILHFYVTFSFQYGDNTHIGRNQHGQGARD